MVRPLKLENWFNLVILRRSTVSASRRTLKNLKMVQLLMMRPSRYLQ